MMAEARALLTDNAIKKAAPVGEDGSPKERRLHDRDGLYLTVSLGGKKWWRLKFHYAGKERRMGLGTYPEVSLKEARQLRDEARTQLRKGLNPQVQRKLERAQAIARHENSFELVRRPPALSSGTV